MAKLTKPMDVVDDAETDDRVPDISYDVVSYGSDLDVEGLVSRLTRGDIIIPEFQRDFVWRQKEASRFIESLLLGLPVPGVFFATEAETNKLLVIDGQQRLKTLMYFRDGYFDPRPGERKRVVFRLIDVQKRFAGCTYAELEPRDQLRLNNSVIHATIVKQMSPPKDDTSIFHIFERLNSGGRRLTAQEIRVALYHGKMVETIRSINDLHEWRQIFGPPHQRLKDQELILRFFALLESADEYQRPMGEFLNKYLGRQKNSSAEHLEHLSRIFSSTTTLFAEALGRHAFRPVRALNAAVFDSCMVGLARRAAQGLPTPSAIEKAYADLLEDPMYLEATSRSTADEGFVKLRLNKATEAFSQA